MSNELKPRNNAGLFDYWAMKKKAEAGTIYVQFLS